MELLKISIVDSCNLNFYCNSWLCGILLIIGFIFFIYKYLNNKKFFQHEIDIDEFELGIGTQKIKFKPNYQTTQIAYKLWVELNTRKLGLPIDENNDIIIEIYDSWYSFFKIARELIKEIPANKAKEKSTKELIIISSKILNEAIRPHLTKWQARYREWYKRRISKIVNNDFSPQEIQKTYRCQDNKYCYEMLINDMKEVNKKIIFYKKILERIVFGKNIS